MGTTASNLTKGLRDTWDKLGRTPRLVVGAGIIVIFLLSAVTFAMNASGPRYETLWSNLDTKDAGDMVAELERESIPYKLTDGGRTIQVPSDQVYKTRLSLASLGLPSSGIVGFESISGNSIWATDFERRVQYVRALSGELTRTVKSIIGVDDARVQVALPEDTVFAAERVPATAAVLLKLRPMQDLSPSAVKGIMNLVARSVEGLSPNDVTVMDTTGRLLSEEFASDGFDGGLSSVAYESTVKVEKDLEKRLVAMLSPVLGPGNVVCQVRATLNLDQVKTIETAFATDPESPQGVLRSTQQIAETYSGTGTPPGGAAGGLDVPSYGTSGTGQSSYQRTETTTNYEVTEKTTETMVNPGTIKSLSVSVMVNDETLDDERSSLIKESVTAALGLDSAKLDRISVIGMKFDTSLADEMKKSMDAEGPGIDPVFVYGAAVGLALVVGTVILFATRRRSIVRRQQEEIAAAAAQAARSIEEEDLEPVMTAELIGKHRLRDSVEQRARANPDTVATLIKTWLLEDER